LILLQRLHNAVRDALDGLAQSFGNFSDKKFHQQGNVFPPFSQRGHRNRKNTQPVPEIFPKPAPADFLFQIAIGGGDHPHVDFDGVGASQPFELTFLDLMEAVIYEVAKKGEGVIIGHGGQFLLRDFGCALHVLIFGARSSRVRHVMEQENISRDLAEQLIHKSDDHQAGFFRFAYQREWNDLSLFDLVISTEKMTPAAAIDIIVEAAQNQEVKTCSLTALDAMDRLSLEKKIEAALLKNHFDPRYVHVAVPEKGIVLVRGLTESDYDRERLAAVVGAVEGVKEVRSEVSVRPAVLI